MGSWANLRVGGQDVFHWKSEVDPTFLFLFTRHDVTYTPLEDPDDDPYANPTLVLTASAKVLADRLDALGIAAKQTLSRWARGDGPTTATGTWRWLDLRVPIPPILTAAEHAAWMAWLRETAKPAQRHTTYLLGGRVRTPCGRYFHGRTAGRQNPLYVCRHHLTTPAGDPNRCDCRSIRVDTLDKLVWTQVRAALTTATPATRARRDGARRPDGERDDAPSLDIGADTLAARITATAEDISDLQRAIADEYQAARQDGFDPGTARLMLQPRRDELARAQAAIELLHRVRTTLPPPQPTASRTVTWSSTHASASRTSTSTASDKSWTCWTSTRRSPVTTRARPAPGPATPRSHPEPSGTGRQAARPAIA